MRKKSNHRFLIIKLLRYFRFANHFLLGIRLRFSRLVFDKPYCISISQQIAMIKTLLFNDIYFRCTVDYVVNTAHL